jgi:hypothetical protein
MITPLIGRFYDYGKMKGLRFFGIGTDFEKQRLLIFKYENGYLVVPRDDWYGGKKVIKQTGPEIGKTYQTGLFGPLKYVGISGNLDYLIFTDETDDFILIAESEWRKHEIR